MRERKINDSVSWVGAVDWNRRLFDALVPLPDGTSYNAYRVRGREKTALIDAAVIGSYGWSSKAIEQIAGLIPNLKVESLDPVMCRGCPRSETFAALDQLAAMIAERHAKL